MFAVSLKKKNPTDVSFTEAIKVVTRWGHGAGALVEAMDRTRDGTVAPRTR